MIFKRSTLHLIIRQYCFLNNSTKKRSKLTEIFFICFSRHMTERAGLTKVTDLFSDIKRLESDQGR